MKLYSIEHYVNLLDNHNLLINADITNVKDELINLITYNSKEVIQNSLFVCKGAAFKVDYLISSVKSGAIAYVSEKKYDECDASCIIVSDVRKAMAYLAKEIYDDAFEKINLIGLTGTKGKSTTSYYLKYILDEFLLDNGMRECGMLSTNDIFDGVLNEEAHLTTPEALQLHKHFDNAYQSGLDFMTMEVSSQALKYDRVLGVKYNVCAFLNISPDHISANEHSDFNDYFSSKLKIFSQSETACINMDSDEFDTILDVAKCCKNVVTFGKNHQADIYAYNIKKVDDEIHFNVRCDDFDKPFVLTMPGLFNVDNALCAIAICNCFNIPYKYMYDGLRKAKSNGRMEIYNNKDKKITVIVDYAHNKLSFEKLFESVTKEYPNKQIITVFGCPGNKAYNRRKELGEISGRYSDIIYLTEDDPEFEEISDISNEIEKFILPQGCKCIKIDNRGEAIKSAIFSVKKDSIILLLGKGSEKCNKVNGSLVPYLSDSIYAKMYLDAYDEIINTKKVLVQ